MRPTQIDENAVHIKTCKNHDSSFCSQDLMSNLEVRKSSKVSIIDSVVELSINISDRKNLSRLIPHSLSIENNSLHTNIDRKK